MELRQLRHFLALAEELHFGRAADRVHISQPALSASVAKLEHDFGVALFARDRKNVRITLAGQQLLEYAREQLNHEARTLEFARSLANGKAGRISLGFSPGVMGPRFDPVLVQFRSEHPDIELRLIENTSQRQIELVRMGEIDAGLVGLSVPPPRLEYIELMQDNYVVCVPKTHPLAARRSLDITELRDEPFVILSREHSSGWYDMVVGLCVASGFHPTITYHTEHTFSTLNLVQRGLGVTLVLEGLSYTGFSNLAFVRLKHPMSSWRGFLVWNAKRFAPGLELVIESFRRVALKRNLKPGLRSPSDGTSGHRKSGRPSAVP